MTTRTVKSAARKLTNRERTRRTRQARTRRTRRFANEHVAAAYAHGKKFREIVQRHHPLVSDLIQHMAEYRDIRGANRRAEGGSGQWNPEREQPMWAGFLAGIEGK